MVVVAPVEDARVDVGFGGDGETLDEVRDERLYLTLGFGHTALPGDYRSRAKVDLEAAANDALLKQRSE